MREKAKDDLKSFALTAMSQSTRGTGTYGAAQHDQELLSTWPRSVLSAYRQRRIASLGWRLRSVDAQYLIGSAANTWYMLVAEGFPPVIQRRSVPKGTRDILHSLRYVRRPVVSDQDCGV